MSPLSKRYKKEYSFELLRIAEGDLQSAWTLFKNPSGRLENIAYLAQQSVEKTLKAVLCFLQEVVPHTHDVAVLIALLPPAHQPPHATALKGLTEYALGRRYEESPEIIQREDFETALQLADQTLLWAQSLIK
jgi:HEPN domain-containing protein